MIDVLLVQPMRENIMGSANFPPLGLGYLAAVTKNAGYTTKILDCMRDEYDYAMFKKYIQDEEPKVVGFTVYSNALNSVKKYIETIKDLNKNIITVAGGPHPSGVPEHAMDYLDVDYGWIGEAEYGFPPFLNFLFKDKEIPLSKIPGLIYRQNGKTKWNKPHYIQDLDTIPKIDWDMIEPEKYYKVGSCIGKDTAVIISTRGCPFECTFCSSIVMAGRIVRRRTIKNIIDELKYLKERYKIKVIALPDENITIKPKFINNLCKAIIKENLNMRFVLLSGVRLDTLNLATLKLMRRAGFVKRVAVGIENGSDRVLKLMKKGTTVKIIREKLSLMRQAGFKPLGYCIIGFPGETKKTIMQTIKFCLSLPIYGAGFTPFLPYPGTEAHNNLVRQGKIDKNFDYSQLTTDAVVYVPEGMTREEINRLKKYAVLRFHLRPKIIWDHMKDFNTFVFALKKLVGIFLKK